MIVLKHCLVAYSASQLQVSVDQKHLAEARSGILSILHTIMSSVTLLWSVLHQADNSDKPAAASAASTSNINLGSTKVHQATWVHSSTKACFLVGLGQSNKMITSRGLVIIECISDCRNV